jgi:hypothetical protein
LGGGGRGSKEKQIRLELEKGPTALHGEEIVKSLSAKQKRKRIIKGLCGCIRPNME